MALAVLILRRREPNSKRPISAPLGKCFINHQTLLMTFFFFLVCVYVFLAFTAYALIFVLIPVENKYYPYWRT